MEDTRIQSLLGEHAGSRPCKSSDKKNFLEKLFRAFATGN